MAGFTPVSSMIRNELADPIGVDQVIRKNRQTEFSNELARMAAETDQVNASQFQRQNDLQAQRQQMQIDAAKREEYRQTGLSVLGWLDQNQGRPEYAQMLQQLAADPESQQAAGALGIDLTKLNDPAYRAVANAKLRVPVPEQVQQMETIQGPGGSILQRDPVTRKLTQVVAPRAPAGGAVAPTKPNWTKIERPLGDGRVEVGVIDMNAPNPESTFRAVGKPTTPGNQQPGNVTEGERKVAALGVRLEGALRTLNSLATVDPDAAKPGLLERGAEAVLGETAANAVRSSNRQQADAAQLDALDAALTLATGAAYTAEQLKNLRKSYFPQIGDSDATKQAKELRFKTVVESARVAAGRAEPNINAALDRAGAATPAAGGWSIQEIP